MQQPREIADHVRAFAEQRKRAVDGPDPCGPDLDPMLVVIRDDQIMAVVYHPEMNRLARGVGHAAFGYGADALCVVLDAVHPIVPTNPLTGTNWAPGEALQVWRHADGVRNGWVSECLLLTVVTRAQQASATAHPFHSDATGELVWAPAQTIRADSIHELLSSALAHPPADPAQVPDPGERVVAGPDAPRMDAASGRLALDIGVTRILDTELFRTDGGAALVLNESDIDTYLDAGLPSWQVLPRAGVRAA